LWDLELQDLLQRFNVAHMDYQFSLLLKLASMKALLSGRRAESLPPLAKVIHQKSI
jgi:hypothetical protein